MNNVKAGRLIAVVAMATVLLGGCSGTKEPVSSLSEPTATVTTTATTTTAVATTETTTTVPTAASSATTTERMTTVTLGKDDPHRDYGTPDIKVKWDVQAAKDVLELMNEARAKEGIAPLKMDNGRMMNAAKTRALDITVAFEHFRPNGDGFFSVFTQFDVDYAAAGENLAAGQPTAAIAFESWWNSETHKANMMNARFTHVSIAAMTYEGEPYWVQLFRAEESKEQPIKQSGKSQSKEK